MRAARLALALVALCACEAGVAVEVESGHDGRGHVEASVRLDRAAAEQVPDLASELRVDDLREAGWRIEGPDPDRDGGTQVKAVKSFDSPAGATRAVGELTGPTGPFRDFRLSVERSFLKTRTAFRGEVDLSSGLEGFGDDVLRSRLGGSVLGVEPAVLERQLGTSLREVFHFEVRARLPGQHQRVWHLELGQRAQLVTSAERWNRERVGFGLVAVVSALALAVTMVRRMTS